MIVRTLCLLVVLLIGTPVGKTAPLDARDTCDRERSRLARGLLNEYLFPLVHRVGFRLDHTCHLHPENDLLVRQEEQKYEQENGLWQCNLCKKQFREEEFIDKHMASRHPQVVYPGASVCLADFCDVLHCDEVERALQGRAPPSCRDQDAQRRRRLCQALSEACFPPDRPLGKQMNEFVQRQFCEAHTCDEGRKLFPEGKQRRASAARYFVLTGLAVVMLALFYGGLYVYQKELAQKGKGRFFSSRQAARLMHLRKHKVQ